MPKLVQPYDTAWLHLYQILTKNSLHSEREVKKQYFYKCVYVTWAMPDRKKKFFFTLVLVYTGGFNLQLKTNVQYASAVTACPQDSVPSVNTHHCVHEVVDCCELRVCVAFLEQCACWKFSCCALGDA